GAVLSLSAVRLPHRCASGSISGDLTWCGTSSLSRRTLAFAANAPLSDDARGMAPFPPSCRRGPSTTRSRNLADRNRLVHATLPPRTSRESAGRGLTDADRGSDATNHRHCRRYSGGSTVGIVSSPHFCPRASGECAWRKRRQLRWY